MPRLRTAAVAAAAVALVTLAGCGSGASAEATSRASLPSDSGSPEALSGTVTVLAAASLTEAFTTLADQFQARHPGVTVKLSFGSSTTLAQQIDQGAPADLYASAGAKALDQLPAADQAKPTTVIARNTLEIATPPGNPRAVTTLSDLAGSATQVVLCAETVPCGAAADQILTKAGVAAHVVSREVDVKATLAKVALGEADAAIVYRSDVATAQGGVVGVEIPADQNSTLTYPLVTLTTTAAAQAFSTFIAGPEGEAALTKAGFLAP